MSWVPLPFDEDADIEWTAVWSFTRQEGRLLPTAYCCYDYPVARDVAQVKPCSNGNASGNTLEEAILQGFLQLVERDGVALRSSCPACDTSGRALHRAACTTFRWR